MIWFIDISIIAGPSKAEEAIDYLREQLRVLLEQQEKQNKRILLNNNQRIRIYQGNKAG